MTEKIFNDERSRLMTHGLGMKHIVHELSLIN